MQKLMWKLNKSIVKEMLPTQAVDFRMEPWWVVCFVNLTTDEYRVNFEKTSFFDLNFLLLSSMKCICKWASSWFELGSWIQRCSFHEKIETYYSLEFYDGALRGTSCHGVEIVRGGDGSNQWRRWK